MLTGAKSEQPNHWKAPSFCAGPVSL